MRVEFLKALLTSQGHECVVLNIGRSRTQPSPEYETVLGAWDYVRKVWRFSRRGYVVHMHVNGDSEKGFVLTLLAEFINLLHGKRCFLTFHAGVDQIYFPRHKARWLVPMYKVMFGIPRHIICNSDDVKAKIAEYGVDPAKVTPIPAFSTQYLSGQDAVLPVHLEHFLSQYTAVFSYVRIRPGFYLNTLIEGFALVARERPEVGLVLCGVSGDIDATLMAEMTDRIGAHKLESRVCVVEDLDHDQFLLALKRSALYLRTPTTDGVASSVLEAISLGVPVVASQNGTRPEGTITYAADSASEMASRVGTVLAHRESIVASLPTPTVRDTLAEEAALLVR